MKTCKLRNAGVLAFSLITLGTATHDALAHEANVSGAAVVGTIEQQREQRVQEAIKLFKVLLTAPVEQLPKWTDFVDKMVALLEGTRYDALAQSLKKVRSPRGWNWRITIKNELEKHFETLPKEVTDLFKGKDGNELTARIKG